MIPEQFMSECATSASARAAEPKQYENADDFLPPTLSPGRFDFSLTSRLSRRLGAAVRQTLDGIADATASMVKEWDEMEDRHHSQDEDEDEEDMLVKIATMESLSSSDQSSAEHIAIDDGQVHNKSFLHLYLQKFEQERSHYFVTSCRKAHSKLPWEVWVSASNTTAASDPTTASGTSTFGGAFVEHAALKEAILKLSEEESSFTEPILENNAMLFDDEEEDDGNVIGATPSMINPLCILQRCTHNQKKMGGGNEDASANFLTDCQATTQRLCQIDSDLQLMHDKLVSGSTTTIVTEELFWRNYFYHCERLRIQMVVATKERNKTEEDDEGEEDDTSLVKIGAKDLEEIPKPPRIPRTTSEGSFVFVCDNETKVEMNQ